MIGLLVTLFSVTVLFLRALRDAFQLADRISQRNQKHIDSLLSRIMASDWRAWREAYNEDTAEEGGQILPTPDSEMDGEFLSTHLTDEELQHMAHERTLMAEDFPDENR